MNKFHETKLKKNVCDGKVSCMVNNGGLGKIIQLVLQAKDSKSKAKNGWKFSGDSLSKTINPIQHLKCKYQLSWKITEEEIKRNKVIYIISLQSSVHRLFPYMELAKVGSAISFYNLKIQKRHELEIFNRGTEATTRGVLWKKVFLKILQNSQENTYARVSFLKRDSGTGVFLWILQNFQEHFFYRTPLDNCFWRYFTKND